MSYLKTHFSEKERKEVEELKKSSTAVYKLVMEVESFYEDPAKMLYKEIVEVSKVLAKDLSSIRSGEGEVKIIGADKDDKLYDRVMKLLTDSAKIFDGIAKGKRMIDPEMAKKEDISKNDDGIIL